PGILGAGWLAAFAGAYTLVVHNARSVSSALGLGGDTSDASFQGVLRDGWHAFAYPVGFARTSTALAATAACVGALWLLRDRGREFAPAALTVVAAMGASIIGRYPFYDRFLLFLVPIVLLAV